MLCLIGIPWKLELAHPNTDAASTPTYKEKHMAITTIQPGSFYDINRDMHFANQPLTSREAYDREMFYRRQQEDEYRRMQNSHYVDALRHQPQLANTTSKPDPKDPLAFLTKIDNKILLTGEAT